MLELVAGLEFMAGVLCLLFAGGMLFDLIFAKSKWLNRYIDKLPIMEETDQDDT